MIKLILILNICITLGYSIVQVGRARGEGKTIVKSQTSASKKILEHCQTKTFFVLYQHCVLNGQIWYCIVDFQCVEEKKEVK